MMSDDVFHQSSVAGDYPTTAAAHPSRTDFFTRDVVNQAIAAIPTLGVQQAAEYLASMNVPPEVAIRTLVYRGK